MSLITHNDLHTELLQMPISVNVSYVSTTKKLFFVPAFKKKDIFVSGNVFIRHAKFDFRTCL